MFFRSCFSRRQIPVIRASLTLLLILASTSLLLAQGKKSKGGNGGSDSDSSLRFTITAFDVPVGGVEFANRFVAWQKVNNLSQVAGNYIDDQLDVSAYFFDPLMHGDHAIDLNDVVQGLPAGQFISQAYDINDLGMILVSTVSDRTLSLDDPDNILIGGVIDSNDGFRFRTLPLPPGRAHGQTINNDQDVSITAYDGEAWPKRTLVAAYDDSTDSWTLNAESYTITQGKLSDRLPNGDLFLIGKSVDGPLMKVNVAVPGSSEVLLPQTGSLDDQTDYSLGSPSGVNGWGDFVGGATEIQQVKRRGKITTTERRGSFLFTDVLQTIPGYTSPKGLNNQLDFLAQASEGSVLVQNGGASTLNLVDLADRATAPSVDWSDPTLTWDFFDLNDRLLGTGGTGQTDAPQVCGQLKIVVDGKSIRPKAFFVDAY